jgi:non-specific serine/threonine protein kinase/serine/threonine-protein kinase
VAGVALSVLAIVGGTAATAWQARRVEQQRRRAERRFQDVRALAGSFLFEFHDAIADLPGSTPARELVVRRAAEYLDSLSKEAANDADLQSELADAYSRLAAVQGGALGASLGDTKGALASYRKALTLREALATGPVTAARVASLADLQADLGACHAKAGDFDSAERAYTAALAQIGRLGELDPTADLDGRTAEIRLRQSMVRLWRGRRPEAISLAEDAVGLGEAHRRDHPDDGRARARLAVAYRQLSSMHSDDDPARALALSRSASDLQEALAAAEPQNTRYTRALIPTLVDQGQLLWALGDRPGAIRIRTRALEIAEAQLARDPRDAYAGISTALTRHSLGASLVQAGQRAAGLAQVRRAAQDLEALVAADPTNLFAVARLAGSYYDLGVELLPASPAAAGAERCRALARARTLYRQLRVTGGDARTASLLERVEKELASCGAGMR